MLFVINATYGGSRIVWLDGDEKKSLSDARRCYKRYWSFRTWVRSGRISSEKGAMWLRAGVLLHAIILVVMLTASAAACLRAVDSWAIGILLTLVGCTIALLFFMAFSLLLSENDADLFSLMTRIGERKLLKKIRRGSLSRVDVTNTCRRLLYPKLSDEWLRAEFLEEFLGSDVDDVRAIDICKILEEDYASRAPMRKSLRMELERKLNVAIDRYLARQTAAKEAEEWRRKQLRAAKQREQDAKEVRERELARGLTTVREQRAAVILGLNNPSDADLMASLEVESESETES